MCSRSTDEHTDRYEDKTTTHTKLETEKKLVMTYELDDVALYS